MNRTDRMYAIVESLRLVGTRAQTRARLIEPMALARTRQQWHVLAWCHLRHGGRWFRMDRITKANATNIPCEVRSLREVFGEPPEYAQPVGSMHGL